MEIPSASPNKGVIIRGGETSTMCTMIKKKTMLVRSWAGEKKYLLGVIEVPRI